MTRRSFFRILGVVTITAPVALPLVAEKLASVRGSWWQPVQWWTKEFDYGNELGVAVAVKSKLTGALRRNAVRLRNRPGAESVGHAFLKTWIRELPPWVAGPAPRDLYGVRFDDVLEGRERGIS